jgi:hypothetical protein
MEAPNNNPTQNTTPLPEQFAALKTGTKFTCDEDAVNRLIISIVAPYGVKHLVLAAGSHKNKDGSTQQMYPHRRFVWNCGSCAVDTRKMDDSIQGCCGFKIRFLLQDKKDDAPPHLEVREFQLPPTSNHLLVSTEARQLSESKVIKSEKDLSPRKIRTLENLGKNRAQAELARSMMMDTHGVVLGKNLLHRVMGEGRKKAWGTNETESLTIFCGEGLKIREYSAEYGVNGKFDTLVCTTTGKLLGWYAQYPLEVLLARAYGPDAVIVDTTHNATTYSFKTGLPGVIDWGGHTAPAGIMQVMEEEIDSVGSMLRVLELDVPGATLMTDGGSSWPEIARQHRQPRVEDTFHNSENADAKAKKLRKNDQDKFGQLKKKVLYTVLEEDELDAVFAEMREVAQRADDNGELMRWIDRMEDGKTFRTATYSTRHMCCSEKGATSRCEQRNSSLKNAGTSNSVMKHWTLGELQNRHLNKLNEYINTTTEEIEDAIKEKRDLSFYVLDWESKERLRADGLEIVNATESVPNPFRMQSTKREMLTINLERPEGNVNLGLTLDFCNGAEEFIANLKVTSIAEGSFCDESILQVGMRIYEVNGKSFSNLTEGVELLKSSEGQFTLYVEKPPSIGTVYTIQRKGKGEEKKMLRTVFIPDSNDLHCQSDYHVHTCSFIRCRYIQRALISHKTRSMKDLSTIHPRWHLKNCPMYPIVHKKLVTLMKVPGLGTASLPAFLAPTPTSTTAEIDEEIPQKVVVPKSKTRRYNEIMTICKQIISIAEEDDEVFRTIIPQLQQMYQTSVYMAKTGSKKARASRAQLAAAGVTLPIVPDNLRKKRDKSDDVNLANKKKQSKRNNSRTTTTKAKSPRNNYGDGDGRTLAAKSKRGTGDDMNPDNGKRHKHSDNDDREEKDNDDEDDDTSDDDDNMTLADLRKNA